MSVNGSSSDFWKRRVVIGLGSAVALLLASATSWTLPDNPRDPPLPPSTFGNLFEDGSLAIHSCRILSDTGTQAVLNYISTFPRTEVSYWQRTASWSTWRLVTGSSYTCALPNCLWGGAQVRIRGCDSGGVCYAPGCTITLGVAPGGPPAVSPVALPTTASTVAGCAQTGHATVQFEARWIGAPASGYPQAEDELGNSLMLTQISRATVGGVEVGTYTIPGSSSWVDGGSVEIQVCAGIHARNRNDRAGARRLPAAAGHRAGGDRRNTYPSGLGPAGSIGGQPRTRGSDRQCIGGVDQSGVESCASDGPRRSARRR